MSRRQAVYSAAYIMPVATQFAGRRKHDSHLALIEAMVQSGVAKRVTACRNLRGVFDCLRAWRSLGGFLAYQFAIDLNYADCLNCTENDFVEPGPGASSGLRKCFTSFGDYSEADVIRWVTERQSLEFERLGIATVNLFGRPLQLIDCQNLFCEFDKYSRVAYPGTLFPGQRSRIKQRFRRDSTRLPYVFPPKWKLQVPRPINDVAMVGRDGEVESNGNRR